MVILKINSYQLVDCFDSLRFFLPGKKLDGNPGWQTI